MEKVCRTCKRLVEEKECVVCRGTDLTTNWKGVVVVYDVDAEIAKKSGHEVPGKYALQVV